MPVGHFSISIPPPPGLRWRLPRARNPLDPSLREQETMKDAIIPPGRFENNNATPTRERAVASYPARRSYKPYIQRPPRIEAVRGMIDIHCHAEHGQQDALAVAKLASENGMSH